MSSFSLSYNEQDNDWANDIQGKALHISQAKSGAQGYYCLGCDKEMQAVKGSKKRHHYRHHVVDVDTSKVECVHASRVYREKLAFNYFLRTKKITVPAVYKFPPKGVEGLPFLLQKEQTFIASKVERELTFYENEEGEICNGKNPEIEERFLLVRPDAIFFDEEGKPILFIEFVITHKPDQEKLAKLRRLGINTVQIIVPKKSEEEIEKAISKVSNIKWTYHEIESNTKYTPVSKGNPEGIPSLDDDQRKLFEESFACRATQIGNLIRTITRSLESESYQRTERLFEQEIQRIENAASELSTRLGGIQEGIENSIHSESRGKREELDTAENQFQEYYSNLEGRYNAKRRKLRYEQVDTEREIAFRQRVERTEEGIRREFEGVEREIISGTEEVEREFEYIRKEEEELDHSIRENTAFESNFEGGEDIIRKEFGELEKSEQINFERKRDDIETKIRALGNTKIEIESHIRSEFERRYEQITERINNRDVQGGDDLSERIKTILDLRGIFGSYSDERETLERFKKGIQLIKNGAWKKWD